MTLDWTIVSPGLPHHGGTLAERSLGGSETAAIQIARALVQRGHHVVVLSPGHQGGVWDGVLYLPLDLVPQYLSTAPHAVTVVSRAIEVYRFAPASAVRILWFHDLLHARSLGLLGAVAGQIDALYAPSAFHCAQIAEQATLFRDAGRIVQTRNGVRLADFDGLRRLPRDRWKLCYGSRPERGLAQALDVMDELRRRGTQHVLAVSHYENTTPEVAPLYEQLFARAQQMPNVRLLGPLLQAAWRRELATARALLYPHTPGVFREISCLAAIEAQAAGTPVIAAAKGALPETVGPGAGILLGDEDTDPGTPAHIRACADAVQALDDDATWTAMSAAARSHASGYDWSTVAAQWEADAVARLALRANDPWRVRRYLERIGEREGLARLGDAA